MNDAAPPIDAAASYRHCRAVARRAAGNFYHGMRLTPEPKRSAIFALYAWMRQADDHADGGRPPRACLDALKQFQGDTHAAVDPATPLPDGALWPAVRDLVQRYRLDRCHLDAMLDAQRDDALGRSYGDFDGLYRYCYRVASVVGLCCVRVWGDDGHAGVKKLAEYRGVALQLTNILRDVAEDAGRGRVYLPAEDLDRFGYPAAGFRERRADEAFHRLMQFQIERARSYYDMSASLERHLSPDCRATSWAIRDTYRRLLERIAARPEAVLTRRVSLPLMTKLGVVTRAMVKQRW